MGEWECMECGYIALGQKWFDHCPECDAPTEAFEYFEYEEDNFEDFDDLDESDEDYEGVEAAISA